jgi:hypothetical protein
MSRRSRALPALLAVLALVVAGCGDSPEDDARSDGKAVGEAIYTLRTATSAEERGRAIDTIRERTASVRDELQPAIATEIQAIGVELRAAAEEGRDAASSAAALRSAALDARARLDALSSDTDSVLNEFRRGVREGYEDAGG